MGFRRKKEDVQTEHKWRQFVSDNTDLMRQIGLPEWVSDEHEYWTDIILYGYPEQYQSRGPAAVPGFDVTSAKPQELTGFVRLLELYFEASFAYYDPAFLKWGDRPAYDRITARFAPAGNPAYENAHGGAS